jgi:hypothetical protein
MGAMIEEQRKSRNASLSTRPAINFHPVNPNRLDGHRNEPRTPVTGQPLQPHPIAQAMNRTASPIACAYQNPKRHKKILAQKGLDKVYIYYQSAMTTT